jgi:hypothetical protein
LGIEQIPAEFEVVDHKKGLYRGWRVGASWGERGG